MFRAATNARSRLAVNAGKLVTRGSDGVLYKGRKEPGARLMPFSSFRFAVLAVCGLLPLVLISVPTVSCRAQTTPNGTTPKGITPKGITPKGITPDTAPPTSTPVTVTPDTANPSPVAPGDLSKPVFDTRTPVFDSVPGLDKAATQVVAEVEGRPITMGDVGDVIRALPPAMAKLSLDTLYPGILDQLVKQQALVVRAQQQGMDEEPPIRRKVRAAADRALAEAYIDRFAGRDITEQALLARYQRDIAGRPGPEEVHARVILVDSEKAALDAIAEIHGGADFAAVARRVSKDSTASTGGDLGFHTRDGMGPEVGAVAFALAPGQLAPNPVRTGVGWFVIKTEERRQQPTPPYAEMREQLRQAIMREAAPEVLDAALQGLKVRRYSIGGKEMTEEKPEDRTK
jgi:peptidyl-prolyl cis-trans isomerase C